MKRIIKKIINDLFKFTCSVFRCNVKRLNDVYEETLPLNPALVKQTLMYKRVKRFIKIALVFRQYELVLEGYEKASDTAGRCIWNAIRDETKYIISEDDNSVFLGKWKRGDFVEVASIQKEAV